MSEQEQGPEARVTHFRMDIPAEEMGGRYANVLSVWHTIHEFTLDFASTQPPQVDAEDADAPVVVPCQVVARVKIPVSLVFDVLRALNENMTHFEEKFGPIRRPGTREEEMGT